MSTRYLATESSRLAPTYAAPVSRPREQIGVRLPIPGRLRPPAALLPHSLFPSPIICRILEHSLCFDVLSSNYRSPR